MLNLVDILPLEKWTAFENDLYMRSGMSVNIFNPEGIRITDNMRWVNQLCPEIKANPKGKSFICAVAHMNLAVMAKQSGQPVVEECDAGLVKIVVPILAEQDFIGTVGACGMLPDDGEVDVFVINQTTGIDNSRIENLTHSIKKIKISASQELSEYITACLHAIVKEHKYEK